MDKYDGCTIADFGCGEGKLHLKLLEAGHKAEMLHSFDAGKMEGSDHVTQCDIAKVPLPSGSVDVVVFCLSLMGTNFPAFLREANRVLRPGGTVFIAEVLSRFENVDNFASHFMPMYCGFKNHKL